MPIGKPLAGFTYIGLLIVIAIAGIGMSAVGVLWKTEMQREREKELLFIGHEFSRAIASYYAATPGGVQQLPKSLDDLLLDKRFPVVKRHLRKIYTDPMTGTTGWGLQMQQGMISGVYSMSELKPIKSTGFGKGQEGFENAPNYRAWLFSYTSAS